jgi:membrane protease YdiL (CAAX protease family)
MTASAPGWHVRHAVSRRLDGAVLAAAVPVLVVAAWALSFGAERVVALLLLAPLLEETALRAGLHELLLARAPRIANVSTALAFGAAHALLRGDPLAFAVALPAWGIGLVYERWRRVRLCVALHALCNAVWIGWAMGAWP